jgi:superfamily II RNA helicase
MVKICNENFNIDQEDVYKEHFSRFSFPLSDFQKYSIKSIVDGDHSLISVSTGSGKTLPGEFAIQHFVGKGKRVIYTVPIKALGNQKFYDFSKKFPDITFGLLTGDIKANITADVLIMTQEILMNFLFLSNTADKDSNTKKPELQFQIDMKNELGAVILDEIHYIMDDSRGSAWESSLLMIDKHVQLIMLSATLDNPVKLASWIEERHSNDDKQVTVTQMSKRIVPLIHYTYLTTNESIFKKVKDKTIQGQIRQQTNKLLTIKTENGNFQEQTYIEVKKMKQLFENNNVFMKRSHVLNNLAKLLVEQEMLPAIFYSFSRKNVETLACELTTNLLEFDSKIPYTIRNEAEQIIRKLPNFNEYMELPEYEILMKLLEKGIGTHHSGMVPVLKEIVELFIAKGYIKILFCTDSFSCGLNCPIRTTVFTALRKFDGNNEDFLQSHLYSQCSGRAGRRGIDTIGHVVHCNNLFEMPSMNAYREILCGRPQKMESKFNISYEIILNLIKNGSGNCTFKDIKTFVEKSMIYQEIQSSIQEEKKLLHKLVEINCVKNKEILFLRTPIEVLKQYIQLTDILPSLQNKKRKETERILQYLLEFNKFCASDTKTYLTILMSKNDVLSKENEINLLETYIDNQIKNRCEVMIREQVIIYKDDEYSFSQKGRICSMLAEINGLMMADNINDIRNFTTTQLICFLSCFTDVRVIDDLKLSLRDVTDVTMKNVFEGIYKSFEKYQDYNYEFRLSDSQSKKQCLMFDIIDELKAWIIADNENTCKSIVQNVYLEKGISVGDFSKAILKISNISKELVNVCENEGYTELQHNLSNIDGMILKYICTNQSLYV